MATPDFIKAALMEQFPLFHPYLITLQVTSNLVKLVQNQNDDLTPIYFCPNKGLLTARQVKSWKSMNAFTATTPQAFYEALIHSEAMEFEDANDIENFVINARNFLEGLNETNDGSFESSKLEALFEYLGFTFEKCTHTDELVWRLVSWRTEHKFQPCAEVVVRYI